MVKRQKQPIKIAITQLSRLKHITVMRRDSPIWTYNKSINSLNNTIKGMKKDIRKARLLKIQAYIAYRLTK